jgi:hypothetical protein
MPSRDRPQDQNIIAKLSFTIIVLVLLAVVGLAILVRLQMASSTPVSRSLYPKTLLFSRDHPANFSIPGEDCTLDTCSIIQAQILYDPSFAANTFFLAYFSVLLLAQIVLCVWYKTWGYSIGTVFGLALEVSGYVGRVQMSWNPFQESQFML